MGNMDGKTVVVTGGSSGIGAATAKTLAARGAHVVLFARDDTALREVAAQLGGRASWISGNVSNEEDVGRLFAEVAQDHGGVDGLFVNAGVAEFVSLEQADVAHFTRLFDANVLGALLTLKAALPCLRPGASVVFNASVSSRLGAPRASVYAATKGAVVSFARNVATELLPRGVRVNVVSPGPTETPILAKAAVDEAGQVEMAPYLFQRMRMGRLGRADETAKAVAFLLSEESSFITGQELFVDGGMSGL